jgi:uncharacterized phage protein (TIGR01671 family)
MSRAIKFRVWEIQSKKMTYLGRLFCWEHGFCDENFVTLPNRISDVHEDIFSFNNHIWQGRSKERFNIQQFTGLLDKNGVEIYEGDILTFSPERQGKSYVVEFWPEFGYVAKHVESSSIDSNGHEFVTCHFFAAFQWDRYHDVEYQYEVIGNIFQNPELLTK